MIGADSFFDLYVDFRKSEYKCLCGVKVGTSPIISSFFLLLLLALSIDMKRDDEDRDLRGVQQRWVEMESYSYRKRKWQRLAGIWSCSVLLLASWCIANAFDAQGVILGCKLLVGESRALLWWAGGNLLWNFHDCFLFSCAGFREHKDSMF